jgi:hypothetical protein
MRALGKGSASQQKPLLDLFGHHSDSRRRIGVTRMMTVVTNVEIGQNPSSKEKCCRALAEKLR